MPVVPNLMRWTLEHGLLAAKRWYALGAGRPERPGGVSRPSGIGA